MSESWIKVLFKFYDIREVVKVKPALHKKIVEVKILFHPKKIFNVTPEVTESKAVFHLWDSGKIDFYDMIYIRKDTMPLLRGVPNLYVLDEWLENKSYELLYKKVSETNN
jgi:hypothetical protein